VAEVTEGSLVDGRYRVLHRIGSGGMADVWVAEDAHLQRRVALKVLHNRFAQDREFVERFRREAEAAANLQHPHVVGVYDRGDVDGTYYIAMEYLEGRSLKELIDAGLTPSEAVALVRQILDAARFAHRHGVVHRDLKPQNVIVDSEGKAKVTDFGIARAGVSEITQTGSVMGTAHYLSPEQAQGLEVTAASDLYSIGVILYEALTGRVPFEADSAVAVALKQVSQSPQRPSTINPEVSPALDAVVMRALEKDPARRFRDADAFIAALDAAEREPGAPAAGDTAAYAAAPIEGAVPPPPVTVPPAEEEPRRRRVWMWIAIAVLIGLLAGGIYAIFFADAGKTTVPNVINQPLGVANNILGREGFDVATSYARSDSAPRNTVTEQNPVPGDVSQDCAFLNFFCSKPTVELTVSSGPGRTKIPDVSGLSQTDAEKKLHKAGISGIGVSTQHSDAVSSGDVIGTDPPAGSVVSRTSRVTLLVSSGVKLVSVPPLVGRSRASAVATLRAKGLVPSVTTTSSGTVPKDQVISQSPSAGSEVDPGSTVSLSVSAGPKKVTVPNVVNKDRATAVSTLRGKGFSVTVETQDSSDPTVDGIVLSESPAAGSTLDQGSTVTITVGHFTSSQPPTTTTPRR